MAESPQRVFLWCVPRTVSTALTKCLSHVESIEIWHEPYAIAYLNKFLYNPNFMADNPKMQKLRKIVTTPIPQFMEYIMKAPRGNLKDQSLFSYSWVKQRLDEAPSNNKKYVFCKDMAFSIDGALDHLPNVSYRHTFLIRDPKKVYPSWKKMAVTEMLQSQDYDNADLIEDIPCFQSKEFFKASYRLWKMAEEMDNKPIIIDADDLINFPELILPKYFQLLNLPWNDNLLKWDASQEVVQQWNACFTTTIGGGLSSAYSRAFRSSCFLKSDPTQHLETKDLGPDIAKCVEESMQSYSEMYEARIQPN